VNNILDSNRTKSNFYKILILLISFLFIVISFINFFETITLQTDENIFVDPISKYYVIRQIDDLENKNKIKVGDFITKINDIPIDSINQIKHYLFQFNDTNKIKISAYSYHRKKHVDIVTLQSSLKEPFFVKLSSAVMVLNVAAEGASDRAGIKVGDIITKINGRSFRNSYEANELMLKSRTPETEYEILRDGQTYRKKVELAKYGISFSHLIFFFTGLLFIATGFFIGFFRPQFFSARIISFAFLFIGIAINGKLNPYLSFSTDISLYYISIIALSNLTGIFGIAIFIHSLFYFPIELKNLAYENRVLIRLIYILNALFSAAILSIIITNISNPILLSIISYSIGLTDLIIILIIFYKIKKAKLPHQTKSIIKPIHYSILINIIMIFILPIFLYFKLRYFTYLNLLLLLIPLSYIYTIGKYRLLNLDLRIRKNNQYIISVFFIRLAFAVIFFVLVWYFAHINLDFPNLHFTGTSIEVLEKPLKAEYRIFYNTFLSILLSFASLFYLLRIYKKIITIINKKFYRANFDYKKIAIDINHILQENISLDNFIKFISNKIKENLILRKVCIVLFDNCYISCDEEVSREIKDLISNQGHILTNSLQNFETTFRTEYLPENIREKFESDGFSSIIPIKHKDKLYGIALIGEKLSEEPIDSEDFHLILSLLNQSVIIIENLKLYEDLAQRERMKHELELARKIQMSSLPQNLPNLHSIKIGAITIPAFEVGGDFYDFIFKKEHEITAIVGDVSGKGASAALYMSKIQGIIRTLSEFDLSPKELLIKSNKLLHRYIEKNAFISVLITKINTDENKITVARAGHLPLLVYSAVEKRMLELKPKGLILGASSYEFFSSNIEEYEYEFSQGDIFILATDGAIEARNNNDEFGIERLKAVISHFKYLEPDDLIHQILTEIYRFSNKETFDDDLTIVVLKCI